MDADTPITLAAARYSTRDAAVEGFDMVLDAHREGEFDHTRSPCSPTTTPASCRSSATTPRPIVFGSVLAVGGADAVEIRLLTEQWWGRAGPRLHADSWLERRRHGRRLRAAHSSRSDDRR